MQSLRPARTLPSRRCIAAPLLVSLCACTSSATHRDWQSRFSSDAIVMLGEVHDSAEQHHLRLERLRQAFAEGWRPAIAMEQFDREHQEDIERARRERPKDVQYLLDLAAPRDTKGGNWNWKFYRPFVALALEYDVPLIAVNLSRADAGKVVKDGYSAVFDADTLMSLGLNEPIARDWESAQEREIEVGHCQQLPPSILPAMAKAQFARDAVMASAVKANANAGLGLVLLAGNGHVRRDIGVPRWLSPPLRSRVFSVGYLEKGNTSSAGAFDAVVITAAASRSDPCLKLGKAATGP
ncbi:MAG TPA: ChaN family lipoprotein [Steroidobacteraceae bacterium]|nr:ChaN family lipoprotein [Steroidobacteraceae bacterium]